jgi:hypothetical protein
MGTLITTSDGQAIVLNSQFDAIVAVVADALDEKGSTTDAHGRKQPRGFRRFHTVDGREVVVNAEQIAFIGRPEEARSTPQEPLVAWGSRRAAGP